jgi:hypothetical protein
VFKQRLFKELACIGLLLDEEEKKRSKHNRIWVHEMLRKRKIQGEFATLYRELIDDEMKCCKSVHKNVHINLENVLLNINTRSGSARDLLCTVVSSTGQCFTIPGNDRHIQTKYSFLPIQTTLSLSVCVATSR